MHIYTYLYIYISTPSLPVIQSYQITITAFLVVDSQEVPEAKWSDRLLEELCLDSIAQETDSARK